MKDRGRNAHGLLPYKVKSNVDNMLIVEKKSHKFTQTLSNRKTRRKSLCGGPLAEKKKFELLLRCVLAHYSPIIVNPLASWALLYVNQPTTEIRLMIGHGRIRTIFLYTGCKASIGGGIVIC